MTWRVVTALRVVLRFGFGRFARSDKPRTVKNATAPAVSFGALSGSRDAWFERELLGRAGTWGGA